MQPMNPSVLAAPAFEKFVVSVKFDRRDERLSPFNITSAPRSTVSNVV